MKKIGVSSGGLYVPVSNENHVECYVGSFQLRRLGVFDPVDAFDECGFRLLDRITFPGARNLNIVAFEPKTRDGYDLPGLRERLKRNTHGQVRRGNYPLVECCQHQRVGDMKVFEWVGGDQEGIKLTEFMQEKLNGVFAISVENFDPELVF